MSDKLARMGVEVNAETDGLQQGLDQATADLDKFEQSLNGLNTQALDSMLVGLEAQFKVMDADLARLDAGIEATQMKMQQKGMSSAIIDADPGILKMKNSANNLQVALDMVKSKIDMVKSSVATINASPITKLKDAFKAVGDKATESSNKSSNSMSKTIKTVTRFGALLLGMRTIYSVITRSAQAYIGQNEKLQIQINSMFVALGSLLAPAIDAVVGWMTQFVKWVIVAVAYTSKFLNVIFGLNIPIKLSAQLNKNLKQTSKQLSNLASFDELTILQDPNSTAASTPQIDLTPYDMSSELSGIEAFGKKLEELKPIIQPIMVALGLLALAVIAVNFPMAGLALTIGILIGIVSLIISKWDTLSVAQKVALVILGLLTAALIIAALAFLIVNSAMAPQLIIFGLIALAVAAVIAIIALLIIYWNDVTKAVIYFSGKAMAAIINFVSSVISTFMKVGSAILSPFVNAFNSIKNVVSDVWNWILKLFSTGGKIFSGVVNGISNIFSGIVNTLITGINKVIATPFNVINGLLNTIRSTNILGFKPFIGMWSVNPLPVPQIPKLAMGGVSSGPTLAQIGEGRFDEAVIPLGSSPQFASMKQDIADAVIMGMAGINGGKVEVIFQVDGDTWGKASIKNINQLQRQAGKTLIKI